MIQATYELFGAIFSPPHPMLGGVCIDVRAGVARLNQISDFKSENKELQAGVVKGFGYLQHAPAAMVLRIS
jgi:hypothetical protein